MENTSTNTTNNTPQTPASSPYSAYVNPNSILYKPKPKEEKKIDFSKTDYIFMGIFAVLSICLVFFGFFGGMAIGFTISAIALIATLALYVVKKGEFSFVSIASLVLAVLLSVVFTLYATDGLSRFIAFVVLFASTALCMVSLTDETVADHINGVVKLAFSTFLAPFSNTPVFVKSLLKNDKKKTAVQIATAVLAAIPVLAVVIALLTSADAAFEGLVGKIASSLGMTILKLIITAIVLVLLISFAITCKYELNELRGAPLQPEKARKLNSPFAVTFLGLIALVYLVYMFSQTAYFFSAFSGILPSGYEFSFAQYARRGFFETEAIAAINLGLMTLAMWLTIRRENGKLNPIVKGLLTFIGVFTILFIATAISKMVMYIGEYGLTVLRLFTSVFMIATAIVIVAFIIRIFNPELKTMKYAALISMALFTALCLCGIDRTVASYNVNAYLDGKLQTVDIDTLFYSSDSAIPYIAQLTDCENEEVKTEAQRRITSHYRTYMFDGWIYDAAEDDAIRVNFKYGTDFTLSKYLTAKAINSRNIKPYEYEGITVGDIIENPDVLYEQSANDDTTVIEDEDLLYDDEDLLWD